MTNPSSNVSIGSRMMVTDGRYKGHLVEVIDLKETSAHCKFINLDDKGLKAQRDGKDFEPTWFGLDVLEPEVPGATSTRVAEGQSQEA